ncbi:retrotransposable element Tf2 [Tanacetum coccineum]
MSTAYHPQTNGQTEVVNRCLECFLRCMTGEKPKEWSKWLSMAEFWYNTNFHSSIPTTPFKVMYGQTPPIHIPIWLEIVVWNQLIQAREEVIRMLKFHLKRAQDRMKNQANKHRSDRSFEVGSWVYLKLQPHRQVTARQGPYHKLSAKFYGPFLIEEKILPSLPPPPRLGAEQSKQLSSSLGAVAYRPSCSNGKSNSKPLISYAFTAEAML